MDIQQNNQSDLLLTLQQEYEAESKDHSRGTSAKFFSKIITMDPNSVTLDVADWASILAESCYREEKYNLWRSIYDYNIALKNKQRAFIQEEKLKSIELQLGKHKNYYKYLNYGLLPCDIMDGDIARLVYTLNNQPLIEAYENWFSQPPASIFEKESVPSLIKGKEHNALKSIQSVIQRNSGNISKVESAAICIQQAFRKKKREQELKKLINGRKYHAETIDEAQKFIEDANKPYTPKCKPELAQRILAAAKKIKLFSHIRHLTSIKTLTQLLNGGLMGRRSLLAHYVPFRKAALYDSDCDNGDADVICCGPKKINDTCFKPGTVELKINYNRLQTHPTQKRNSSMFYKQKDLGYSSEENRPVRIGTHSFYINHTSSLRCQSVDHASMQFRNSDSSYDWARDGFSVTPKMSLISSNMKEMDAILAMNFFRFLDIVRDDDLDYIPKYATNIYEKFETLDDSQLESTLKDIALKATDTMEFNFYGAFLLDPAFIDEMNFYGDNKELTYTLNLRNLLKSLNNGDIKGLDAALQGASQAFASHRFVDYLLSVVTDMDAHNKLVEHRAKIEAPLWEKSISPKSTSAPEEKSSTLHSLDRKPAVFNIKSSKDHRYEWVDQANVKSYIDSIKHYQVSKQPIHIKIDGYGIDNNTFLQKLGESKSRVNELFIEDTPCVGARVSPKTNINKNGLSTLSELKDLEKLTISNCFFVNNEVLEPLVVMPKLKYLKISHCQANFSSDDTLNEDFLRNIGCSETLKKVSLYSQAGLTPNVFNYLAEAKKLKELTLDFAVTTATANDWQAFIKKLTAKGGLESLSAKCSTLSDEILSMMANWPSLKSLNISYCKGITQTGIDLFKSQRPDVSFKFSGIV